MVWLLVVWWVVVGVGWGRPALALGPTLRWHLEDPITKDYHFSNTNCIYDLKKTDAKLSINFPQYPASCEMETDKRAVVVESNALTNYSNIKLSVTLPFCSNLRFQALEIFVSGGSLVSYKLMSAKKLEDAFKLKPVCPSPSCTRVVPPSLYGSAKICCQPPTVKHDQLRKLNPFRTCDERTTRTATKTSTSSSTTSTSKTSSPSSTPLPSLQPQTVSETTNTKTVPLFTTKNPTSDRKSLQTLSITADAKTKIATAESVVTTKNPTSNDKATTTFIGVTEENETSNSSTTSMTDPKRPNVTGEKEKENGSVGDTGPESAGRVLGRGSVESELARLRTESWFMMGGYLVVIVAAWLHLLFAAFIWRRLAKYLHNLDRWILNLAALFPAQFVDPQRIVAWSHHIGMTEKDVENMMKHFRACKNIVEGNDEDVPDNYNFWHWATEEPAPEDACLIDLTFFFEFPFLVAIGLGTEAAVLSGTTENENRVSEYDTFVPES